MPSATHSYLPRPVLPLGYSLSTTCFFLQTLMTLTRALLLEQKQEGSFVVTWYMLTDDCFETFLDFLSSDHYLKEIVVLFIF